MDDSTGCHRWNFGPIAPGQASGGLYVLILSLGVSAYFCYQAINGLRATWSASATSVAEEHSTGMQEVVLPIGGALLFLFGGGFLGLIFLRAGIEEYSLAIEEDTLTLERSMLGRERRRSYLRKYVGDLRVAEDVPDEIPEDQKGSFNPVNGGVLRFQYGSHTVYLGPQTAKPEAEHLLTRILAVAPDLAQPAPILSRAEEESAEWRHRAGIVSPVADRFTVEQVGSTLRVTIPARSSRYGRFFVTLWLAGWALCIVLVGVVLWVESTKLASAEVDAATKDSARVAITICSIWLFFWSIGGLIALWSAVWARWGRQVIEITPSSINISNRSPLWRTRRTIDRQHAGPIHMRTSLGYFAGLQLKSDRSDSAASGGWLECKERLAKRRFGAGLTRREAEYLLIRLQRIDPSLVKLEPTPKSE